MRQDTLLQFADARVPRYTSYPTAPQFGPQVGPQTYEGWLAELDPEVPVSLYLHVPFCKSMCWYCGCHTRATRRLDPVEAYAVVLMEEIDALADRLPGRFSVSHVHWGGGSPTYLPAARFAALTAKLRERFHFVDGAEMAVEVDPRLFADDMAEAFAEGGVTRASLGVQTFDPAVQSAINRIQSPALVGDCIARLRAAGVSGVNLDLIYGLPLQTEASCRDTVTTALGFAPDRISAFGYAHVPHMKPHQKMIREDELADARGRLAQADAIAETLVAAGFAEIGIDHFARAGDPLAEAWRRGEVRRNFQGYTTDQAETILGLGASAIGWLPQGYVQNTPLTADWERRVGEGRAPIARGYALTDEDRARRAAIEAVMCFLEVDLDAVAAEHGARIPMPDLAELEAAGVVAVAGARLRVDPAFRPLARRVAAAFDAFLPASTARHTAAV